MSVTAKHKSAEVVVVLEQCDSCDKKMEVEYRIVGISASGYAECEHCGTEYRIRSINHMGRLICKKWIA